MTCNICALARPKLGEHLAPGQCGRGRGATGELKCLRLGYEREKAARDAAEKRARDAESEMVAAESQLEWLSDAITGARPIDDFGLSFGVVREAVDLRTRVEMAESALAEERGRALADALAAVREVVERGPERFLAVRAIEALMGTGPQTPSSSSLSKDSK